MNHKRSPKPLASGKNFGAADGCGKNSIRNSRLEAGGSCARAPLLIDYSLPCNTIASGEHRNFVFLLSEAKLATEAGNSPLFAANYQLFTPANSESAPD